MQSLVRTILEIAVLRTPPHAVPASTSLLVLMLGLHLLVGFVHGQLSLSAGAAAGSALLGTLVVAAFVHGMLAVARKAPRTRQTLTALAGCEVVIGLVALPVVMAFQGTEDPGGAGILLLALLGWNLAVATHVFRHALDVSPFAGVAVAAGYMIVSFTVMGMALPSPNP